VISRNVTLTVVQPITIGTPTVSYDFNDGQTPAGTILNSTAGGGYIDTSGGVNNSGVLKLTDAVLGQGGTFLILDPVEGKTVSGFTASFMVRVGGGTTPPADGFSFVWANDVPQNVVFGEDGTGSGLVVSFDIYDNGGGEAPAFNIIYGGVNLATNKVNFSAMNTGDGFAPVQIRVDPDGTVDLHYNNQVIFNNVQLPEFTPIAGGTFAIGGRTGGLTANQWVDNLQIQANLTVAGPRLVATRTPTGMTLTWPAGFKLQSTTNLGNPASWTDVSGANSPFNVSATEPMRFYRLVNVP
jgi:hypothetical protein